MWLIQTYNTESLNSRDVTIHREPFENRYKYVTIQIEMLNNDTFVGGKFIRMYLWVELSLEKFWYFHLVSV